MKIPLSTQDKANRRGCFLLAIFIPLIVALFAGIALGWLGRVDQGKNTDIKVTRNMN